MRKLYYSLSAFILMALSGSLYAQIPVPGPVLPSEQISLDQIRARFQPQERASVGEWLFFDTAYENYFFTTPVANYVNYLFPDSTIMTNPSAPFPVWTHTLGQAYDLTSPAWTFTSNIDFTQPIKIDSIFLWGWYNKINAGTDTLRIQLYTPGPTVPENLYDIYYFANANTPVNLGVDTAYFLDLNYTQPINEVDYPVWTYDVILDDTFFADSAADGTHQPIIVPSNLTMMLNEDEFRKGVFAFTMEFIPGYVHTPFTDVIGSDQNGFRPISAEFNGTDVYPTVTAIGDLTTSYLLTQDVRYGTGGTWNGHLIPMLAYTAPFSWEYIYMVPYISQTNSLAIDPNESDMNFGVYPNPANDVVNIKVNANFSDNGMVRIYDLSGKLVKQFSNMQIEEGFNHLTLDVAELNNGAYVIQFLAGGKQVNKNLVIAK